MKNNKLFSIIILGFIIFSGCGQTPILSNGGNLFIQIYWPQFNIKVIPDNTEKINIVITGENIASNAPYTETIPKQTGIIQKIITLPIGNKTVKIEAVDKNNVVLARGEQQTVINPKQRAVMTVDLQPVSNNITKPDTPTAAPPTAVVSSEPSSEPSSAVSSGPSSEPTSEPTSAPTAEPTSEPTSAPTAEPTTEPTTEPTSEPPSGGHYNSPPVINSITFPSIVTGLSYPVELICNATDPENDNLTYTWSCDLSEYPTGYTIDKVFPMGTNGSKVIWKSPDSQDTNPKNYTITVSVSDSSNTPVTKTITITVNSNTATINLGGGQ